MANVINIDKKIVIIGALAEGRTKQTIRKARSGTLLCSVFHP